MRWFVKSLVYATLLAWPGHWISPAYQSLLLDLTGFVTGVSLAAPSNGSVDLSAANQLTVFMALCLASDFATWSRRIGAICVGLPLLVAAECAAGVLGMSLSHAADPSLQPSTVRRALEQTLELSRWIVVPLAWGALVGQVALRRGTAQMRQPVAVRS